MFKRSVVRATRPVIRQQYRKYASDPNKATSNPKGTHGGTLPNRPDPEGKPKYPYAAYAAAAVGFGGAGYYLLRNKK